MGMNLNKLQETMKDRGDWRAAVCGVTKSQTRLSKWTTKLRHNESIIFNILFNVDIDMPVRSTNLNFNVHAC